MEPDDQISESDAVDPPLDVQKSRVPTPAEIKAIASRLVATAPDHAKAAAAQVTTTAQKTIEKAKPYSKQIALAVSATVAAVMLKRSRRRHKADAS